MWGLTIAQIIICGPVNLAAIRLNWEEGFFHRWFKAAGNSDSLAVILIKQRSNAMGFIGSLAMDF